MDALKERIRHVPDFPKPGILFYDITTLMKDPSGFKAAVDAMAAPYAGQHVDLVVGIESRGFIFGAAVADRVGAGFAPVRKLGKLPHTTRRAAYQLEYGTDSLEIHEDAIEPGQKVLVVDDLLPETNKLFADIQAVLTKDVAAYNAVATKAGLTALTIK